MKQNLKDLIIQRRNVHFIGIGGCGMSAIAKVLLSLKYNISGSDMKESANTIRLKDAGARVFIEHKAENVRSAQIVIVSAAIKEENPELLEAKSLGIPVFARAEMLGYLMSLYRKSIAFAGTHGKTTTSSMASVLFSKIGLAPTFLVGGEVKDLKDNACCGKSDYFIAEADESDGSIQYLNPRIFVLTNIEKDHLDHFDGLDDIVDLFETCVNKLVKHDNNLLVINGDQWGNKILLNKIKNKKNLNLITFGLSEEMNVRAVNIRYKGKGSLFTLIKDGNIQGEIELAIPGEHNVLNALAVIAVALHLGLDFHKIRGTISNFTGAKRRFNLIGEVKGIKIYDDYAHHPTEIRATLEAARKVYPKARLVCAFQPHRYSRTMFFMNEFAESLQLADRVLVTSIYAAGEKPIPEVNAENIVKRIKNIEATYVEKKEDIANLLEKELKSGDVFFTLGAGDIYMAGKEILHRLKSNRKTGKKDAGKIVRIA